MPGIRPAQQPLAGPTRHTRGGDEVAAGTGALGQCGVRPAQQAGGIVGERRRRGERRAHERRPASGLDAVADDQHGGIPRPLDHQIEVAADMLGRRRRERRGELQPGTLRQLRRREGIADRAQVIQLSLHRLQAPAQRGDIPRVQRRLSPQPCDQRLLTVLALLPLAACRRSPVGPGVPAGLCFALVGLLAHGHRSDARGRRCHLTVAPPGVGTVAYSLP
jgi:hypothetical protein